MWDDISYSDDDVIIPEDDSAFDSLDEASLVETICQQEDYGILDSSSMLQNYDYEDINSIGLDSSISGFSESLVDESIPTVSDFLHEQLPDSWFENVKNTYGTDLTDDEIIQSVQQARAFFNMDNPMEIWEGGTTGVINGMTFTEKDDILIFNREQLQNMGITDKEGFDLVMTHEGARCALQGMGLGFSDHQEELCCDYMAGIRAGLNGMDEGVIASTLANTGEYASHPVGALKVQAIEEGVSFAHDYMEEHYGTTPSFSECLDHFEHSDLCIQAYSHDHLDEFMMHNETSGGETLQTAVHSDSSQISFKGYQEDKRDTAASKLQDELNLYHIYYRGSLSSSDLWGGWDRSTGEKIKQAIQDARNSGRISDAKYNELMKDLKNACYYVS